MPGCMGKPKSRPFYVDGLRTAKPGKDIIDFSPNTFRPINSPILAKHSCSSIHSIMLFFCPLSLPSFG